MLSFLRIRNLALIENAELELGPGLTIFSGETGAGKTILLGAIALLLGDRASGDDIRTGEQAAFVEGTFTIDKQAPLLGLLAEKGITFEEDQLFIKREINKQGKNRIFINNSPCPLSSLMEIGDLLIDLHGQHEHQSLLRQEQHCAVIDSFQEILPFTAEYRKDYLHWSEKVQHLALLRKDACTIKERSDLFSFQVEEITGARLQPDEDVSLEEELRILESSEKRVELSQKIISLMEHPETTLGAVLKECSKTAEQLAELDPKMGEVAKLLENAQMEANEAERMLSSYCDIIEHNAPRIEEIHERLSLISKLKKKYGGSLSSVLETGKFAEEQLLLVENVSGKIEQLEEQLPLLRGNLALSAERLSLARKKLVERFNREITQRLKNLGMTAASFEVSMHQKDSAEGIPVHGKPVVFDENGVDFVEMMISPNPGEPLKPLVKIASGGELSRVMLAIKSFIAASDKIPTLIFDEIDSGIGGQVAGKVGSALAKLSKTHQILCVTHLPPIAAKADSHFTVNKKVEKGRTRTVISKVELGDRVKELARMMGDESSAVSLKHAEELVHRE